MLAYSSIAHAGYLLVGVVAIAVVGTDARGPLIYYLIAYTFTTIGAFGVVAWIGSRNDERLSIDDWAGLAGRHPGAALAMTIFMLSLGGIPPTAGFFGKFYVFRAALEKPSLVWLVVVAVLNSVVSVSLLPARRHRDVLPRGRPRGAPAALGERLGGAAARRRRRAARRHPADLVRRHRQLRHLHAVSYAAAASS